MTRRFGLGTRARGRARRRRRSGGLESGDPYLILQLPDPPAGKTWAAWVVRDGQALAAGLTGGRSGVVTLALTRPVQTGDELALTLEDAGGVPVPRGAMVLRGRI